MIRLGHRTYNFIKLDFIENILNLSRILRTNSCIMFSVQFQYLSFLSKLFLCITFFRFIYYHPVGWPMSNVDTLEFKNFIKKYTNADLRTAAMLDNNYTVKLADECQDHIRNTFAEDRLILGCDGTVDAVGRSIAGCTIRSADHPNKGTYLLNYDEIQDEDAVSLAKFLIESLELVFGPLNIAGISDS